MAVSFDTITVQLSGSVASDVERLEIDGVAATIAGDRTWSWSDNLPVSTRTLTMVAICATRVQTRLIEIGSGAVPGGLG